MVLYARSPSQICSLKRPARIAHARRGGGHGEETLMKCTSLRRRTSSSGGRARSRLTRSSPASRRLLLVVLAIGRAAVRPSLLSAALGRSGELDLLHRLALLALVVLVLVEGEVVRVGADVGVARERAVSRV